MLVLSRKANETLHYQDGKFVITVLNVDRLAATIQVNGGTFDVLSDRGNTVASTFHDGNLATLRLGETVAFGDSREIKVTVTRIENRTVRLSSDCAKEIHILRGELL